MSASTLYGELHNSEMLFFSIFPGHCFYTGTKEIRLPHSSTLGTLFLNQTKCMYILLKCPVFSNFLPFVDFIFFTQITFSTNTHLLKSYTFHKAQL